jgi:hypothetical protein
MNIPDYSLVTIEIIHMEQAAALPRVISLIPFQWKLRSASARTDITLSSTSSSSSNDEAIVYDQELVKAALMNNITSIRGSDDTAQNPLFILHHNTVLSLKLPRSSKSNNISTATTDNNIISSSTTSSTKNISMRKGKGTKYQHINYLVQFDDHRSRDPSMLPIDGECIKVLSGTSLGGINKDNSHPTSDR